MYEPTQTGKVRTTPPMTEPRRSRLSLRSVGLAVGVAIALTSCATNAPQDTWAPEGYFSLEDDEVA